MRWAILILASGLLFTACRTPKGEKDPNANPEGDATEVTPVMVYHGRIAFVKAAAKYVVVEGAIGEVPPADTLLSVYRGDQKVGEVKSTKQARSSNYAADIVSGAPQVGDTVRSD